MNLSTGTRLGPYEIVSRIGAGGMGEVWKARDTRLDRSVAIKILPAEFAADAQLRIRFEREAKTISQLEHPHICRLYDVGLSGGADVLVGTAPPEGGAASRRIAGEDAGAPLNYLVMELLEGETLADRVARGPLPLHDVLKYGAQIADALDRAHHAGVVHRDLKPGNVMITKSGAKLLDFGLAKSGAPTSSPAPPDGATEHKPLTEHGTILGTFQYMAPEQVEGNDVDHRADIWALGCLLYEMATGNAPFRAASRASLIGSILRDEPPPLSNVQPLVSRRLERVIASCLAKDPEERWQSARDIANELRWVGAEGEARQESAPRPRAKWPAIAVMVIVAAGIAIWGWPRLRAGAGPAVVVLMDSTHPLRVYDPKTLERGGTNADDLTDALSDVPVTLVKENTSWAWHREEEIVRQAPRLVVIHRSCFYVPPGVGDAAFDEDFYARAADKFEMFLAYVAARNARTKFLVYSRQSWNNERERADYVRRLEQRFPPLKGRVVVWSVPMDRATFRHPQTAAEIKRDVVRLLELER